MSPVPPPRSSPKVPQDDPFEQFDAEHPAPKPDPRSTTGIYNQVQSTTLATKVQWGAIGTVVVAFGVLFSHTLDKMEIVTTAQAQTQATAEAARDAGKVNALRLEAVDAGARVAIERLEKKIDTNNEKIQKDRDEDREKRDEDHALLVKVLAEVKKK